MPVNSTHPAYDAALLTWRRNRDAVEGQDAIKRGRELYLPMPNAEDESPANLARYERYLERALWYAAPERTKNSLVGAVFRKDPEKQDLPTQIEYMSEDIDGTGVSLEQMAKYVVGDVLEVGRVGLLTEYPRAEAGLSQEQVRQRQLRANIVSYPAENIVNWRAEKRGGTMVTTLVVLKEIAEEQLDEFTSDDVTVFRVLMLNEAGQYVQRLYNEDGTEREPEIMPRRADGSPWPRIPFVIAGSENNRLDIDRAPLTHLCNHAVAYWQTSADHRENLFMHGQLTLGVTTDMSHDEFIKANPNGIKVGAYTGVFLGATGAFHTATIPESSSLSKALEDLRTEMAELGAQIIQKGAQNQTAEAARIDAAAESSVLSNVVGNVSEAIEASLEFACEFMGGDPDAVLYTLSQEFFDDTLDPQTRMAMIQELDRGLIGKKDYRVSLRRVGALGADRTDEDIDAEVEVSGPALGMIGREDDEDAA